MSSHSLTRFDLRSITLDDDSALSLRKLLVAGLGGFEPAGLLVLIENDRREVRRSLLRFAGCSGWNGRHNVEQEYHRVGLFQIKAIEGSELFDSIRGRHCYEHARADSLTYETLIEAGKDAVFNKRQRHGAFVLERVVELFRGATVQSNVIDFDRVALFDFVALAFFDHESFSLLN